ncbi:MAG: hypothetical protein ACI9BD_001307 [Candidatus Marinamargulisbacteria bacterium]|jgi:hypothetical protein
MIPAKFFRAVIVGLTLLISNQMSPTVWAKTSISTTESRWKLGNQVVKVRNQSSGRGLTFVNLHDNEETAVRATLKFLKTSPGELIQLRHSGNRRIKFTFRRQTYSFDPNSMFSPAGIKKSLRDHGAYSESAHEKIFLFVNHFLSYLQPLSNKKNLIAVHNNTDGLYSINSYIKGHYLAKEASRVFLGQGRDPDNFFLVTKAAHYNYLKAKKYNVILQNNQNATDDGSLSVFCGRNRFPYINIEVQHGHNKTQLAMIQTVAQMLAYKKQTPNKRRR